MDQPEDTNDSSYDVQVAWLSEVMQRATASDSGDTDTIPFQEAWKRIIANMPERTDS